jgi:hypothetical protein
VHLVTHFHPVPYVTKHGNIHFKIFSIVATSCGSDLHSLSFFCSVSLYLFNVAKIFSRLVTTVRDVKLCIM